MVNNNLIHVILFYFRLSLDNNTGFSRNAFGRQSMSEKRHATLDAKNSDTYQRNKKLREGKGDSNIICLIYLFYTNILFYYSYFKFDLGNGSLSNQLGPALGMKKSSSLESLQTMVQGVQMIDRKTKQSNVRIVRGNDSFRAVMDNNGPLSLHELQTC